MSLLHSKRSSDVNTKFNPGLYDEYIDTEKTYLIS